MATEDQQTTTTHRTLGPGRAVRAGTDTDYREVIEAAGEPHLVRTDLLPGGRRGDAATDGGLSLAHLAHITDVQLIDHQSPGRLECLHQLVGDPRTRGLIPMIRPQELMGAHATDALVRALNAAGRSGLTGAPLQLTISTGDSIDNTQWNEMQGFLALLSGGAVVPDSGGDAYEGVQDGRFAWTWAPEVPGHPYAKAHGFPEAPGILDAARRPFSAAGLSTPWISAYGNHDGLIQGRAPITAALAEILTGDRKVITVGDGDLPDVGTQMPGFFTGDDHLVTADDGRRPLTRQEYMAAHLGDGGNPGGHGFTPRNLEEGTAYYVYDALPGVRIITLDTTNTDGYANGSIGTRQLAWLHERLAEVNPRHLDTDGRWVTGGDDDRLVVIATHHSRDLMDNPYEAPTPIDAMAADGPRHTGLVLEAALHCYPNVVAWINGHIHKHIVEPRQGPAGGYWEITTSSVLEWPSQARLIEILDRSDGTLSLRCTVIDHQGPAHPGGVDSVLDLAAWHRQLAANDPTGVNGLDASGRAIDRNVTCVCPTPGDWPADRAPGRRWGPA